MAGYLGSVPVPQATQHRESFTCTEGQTTFNTAGYTPQFVDVYLNGSHLSPADFTASNGSDVVLGVAASADDVCDIISYTPFEVANQTFTGDFKVDGTTFNVDSTNNRIGIGTASPATVLHIEGTDAQDVDLRRTGTLSNNNRIGQIMFRNDADSVASVNAFRESAEDDAYLTLNTQPSGGSLSERLRISSTGTVLVATGSDLVTNSASGTTNTRIGTNAGDSIVASNAGVNNVLIGVNAGTALDSGDSNIAIGYHALKTEDDHGGNIAIGSEALQTLDVGADGFNIAIGNNAGNDLQTGLRNVIIGTSAAEEATTMDDCVFIGHNAGGDGVVSGNGNVGIGKDAGASLVAGHSNVILGRDAGQASTTAFQNVFIGEDAGFTNIGGDTNTFVGSDCGYLNTGDGNTYIGKNSGEAMTTGSENTIIGSYNGNQDSLDIRTASNRVAISDGDGNICLYGDNNSQAFFGDMDLDTDGANLNVNATGSSMAGNFYQDNNNDIVLVKMRHAFATGSQKATMIQFQQDNGNEDGSIKTSGSATEYNTSSDYRLKENVDYSWDATTRLKKLKPVRFNFILDETNTLVDGFLAHEAAEAVPAAVDGVKDATHVVANVVLSASDEVISQGVTKESWTKRKADILYTENDIIPDGKSVGDVRKVAKFPSDSTWVATRTLPKHQQIDHSKIVPLLVKTILELEARITALEG